jgi:aspartate 1-decarboxylase
VSYANPDYVGSIEIGRDLMEKVGLQDGELVHVWAVDHTSRIQTYVFAGPTGTIGLNGGAAHFFQAGDRVIIAAFDLADEPILPKMVLLDEHNKVVRDMTPFSVVG